jgi:hypothetical protein
LQYFSLDQNDAASKYIYRVFENGGNSPLTKSGFVELVGTPTFATIGQS